MGNAQEIIRYKKQKSGRIIEAVVWIVSEPVSGSDQPFKYRLFAAMNRPEGAWCAMTTNGERETIGTLEAVRSRTILPHCAG